MRVATVQFGHSQFDGAVYSWLNRNHDRIADAFRRDAVAASYGDGYDYSYALLLFIEAGCRIEPVCLNGEPLEPLVYEIHFDLDADSLVSKLDDLLACRVDYCTAPREPHGHCDGCQVTLEVGLWWCGDDGCLPF